MSVLATVHSQWSGEPTAVLSRRVRPGQEEVFRHWAEAFTEVLAATPGCSSCQVLPPVEGGHPEWVFVSVFQDHAALKAWIGSPTRAEWLERAGPLVEDAGELRVISGLEALFGLLPPSQARPPAVWKLALVTLAGLYPTVILSWLLVAPRLQPLPFPLRALASATFTVVVMTWGVMPLVTRAFRPWLFPQR
jgi:antibiotic biosynthesis monooxygenase (ABM) superfamily enzyme